MKKYFIIERSDGKKFNVRNKTEWLIENKLFHLDRSLRDKGWVKNKQDGLKYKCEKDYVESLDEIEFGEVFKITEDRNGLLSDKEVDVLLGGSDTSEDEDDLLEGLDLNPQKAKEICEEEDESFPFGENLDNEYEHLKKNYDKLARQNQYYKDTLRITRRENRFNDRVENVIENFHKEILDNIPKFKPSEDKIEIYSDCYTEGVIQLSDIHCGEYVKGTYNYDIMDKRLNTLFNEAVKEFKDDISGINKITILMTGDLINAANKMDKLLTNLKTRAESLKILFQSLSKQIDFLINKGYKVSIASICGNESRLEGNEYMSGVDEIAVNNMDYLLMVLLEARYKDNIKFLNDGSTLEDMINVNGKNIIISHGHNIRQGSEKQYSDEVLKVKKKWFNMTGIMADYETNGHIHNVWISSFFARSGSLVGGNGYSENTLNIPDSKPSQNIYKIGNKIKAIPIYLD